MSNWACEYQMGELWRAKITNGQINIYEEKKDMHQSLAIKRRQNGAFNES